MIYTGNEGPWPTDQFNLIANAICSVHHCRKSGCCIFLVHLFIFKEVQLGSDRKQDAKQLKSLDVWSDVCFQDLYLLLQPRWLVQILSGFHLQWCLCFVLVICRRQKIIKTWTDKRHGPHWIDGRYCLTVNSTALCSTFGWQENREWPKIPLEEERVREKKEEWS